MTTGSLDRKTLTLGLVCIAVILVLRFGFFRGDSQQVVGLTDSIPAAEQRLERLRQAAATVPGKQSLLQQVNGDLAAREKGGLIVAETAQQAEAQLLSLIQKVAAAEGFDARGQEGSGIKPLGADYGEVSVTVSFTCFIEQLVDFLSSIANQPEILATNEISIAGGNDKRKSVQVRLSLSGVVARKLVPVKKSGGAF